MPYELFISASKMADALGLASVWIPERHYHHFGGAFSCPAVAAGALAASTKQIGIRAGSVISPLHDAIEVAEQWAMVHALSQGRAGLAVTSGWKGADFVTRPERYSERKKLIWLQIEEISALWRGEAITRIGVGGEPARVSIYPVVNLPPPGLWVATSGDPATARRAGALGVGLYTHLVNQSLAGLQRTIRIYRDALPATMSGHVALMIHAYIDESDEAARSAARQPLENYLRQFLELKSSPPSADLRSRIEVGIMRYFRGHSLIGSPVTCQAVLRSLAEIGVDELVCLVDFGLDDGKVLRSIERVARLSDPD